MTPLPHKGPRSRARRSASPKRIARTAEKCQVQPKIFVEVHKNTEWGGTRHAPAKIRIRRGCYRYLVWRDGLFKCEFYLGKIKKITPQNSRGSSPGGPGAAGADRDRGGVQE
jgi:hypothetical protein